jgi:uncharacterized membrane protein
MEYQIGWRKAELRNVRSASTGETLASVGPAPTIIGDQNQWLHIGVAFSAIILVTFGLWHYPRLGS